MGAEPPARGPQRGDIHFIEFPEVAGRVMTGPHPAVIVSSDRLNPNSGTVLVCPLTSKVRHDPKVYLPPYLVAITAQASGLQRDGYMKVNQIFTRPIEGVGPRMGRLSPQTIDRLDKALLFVLGL
jgi:mRNA-degrading endonuclease toxin of MazEF toxin-antitoxin module